MALAGGQLVNILTSPYKGNPSAQGPFPPITSDSPSPQYLLLTDKIDGAFSVNGAGQPSYPNQSTANTAITVEYNLGNQLQSTQILVTQALSDIVAAL